MKKKEIVEGYCFQMPGERPFLNWSGMVTVEVTLKHAVN